MAVQRVRGIENHQAVEGRFHAFFTVAGRLERIVRVQLQLATPVRLPIAIQIQQYVDPPVQQQFPLRGEVIVQTQEPPRRYLHVSGRVQVRIRYQTLDAGELLQELHETRAVERVRDRLGRGPERGRVGTDLLAFVDRVVARPIGLDSRQLRDGPIQQGRARLCLSWYYYTAPPVPGWAARSTSVEFKGGRFEMRRELVKLINLVTPPILVRWAKSGAQALRGSGTRRS